MTAGGFTTIEDTAHIKDILRAHFGESFIPAIRLRKGAAWNGHAHPGGWIIEGARPSGMVTHHPGTAEETTVVSLTNSDVGYATAIGTVNLSDIEAVQLLPFNHEIIARKKAEKAEKVKRGL